MTSLAPEILQLHKAKPLSPAILAAIALGVCALFLIAQFLHLPSILFGILPLAFVLGSNIIGSGRAALYVFIGTSLALTFRMSVTKSTDIIDILAGLVIGSISIWWCLRLLVVERANLTYSVPQLLSALYFVWGLLIGVGGVLWWNNELNDWIREFFIQCPLLIIPMLCARFIEPGSKEERIFHRFVFGSVIAVIMASFAKYAVAATQSLYAYQIGRLAAEPSAAVILLLLCIAFRLYKVKWIHPFWQLLVSVLSVGLVILCGFRTVWVGVTIVVCLLFLITERRLWGNGLRFMLSLTAVLLSIGTYLFINLPIFRIFVVMTVDRALSTTQVNTDPSLLNRYIETNLVSGLFAQSPLTGYGFGAKYQMFDWLLGYSYLTSYSHNGYYFVALKTGIIGLALLFGAYVWFMARAVKIMRDKAENAKTRAIAAVATCYFVCQLISNLTLNVFGERNAMVWIGLFWAFILCQEIYRHRQRGAGYRLVADTNVPVAVHG
jgi:O-antigen ligase